VTLLVNYWKDKTAGEAFTHRLPQEHLYLHRAHEMTQTSDQDLHSRLKHSLHQNSSSSDGQSLSQIPSAHTPTHLSLPRDFKQDLWQWQQQVLPPAYRAIIHQRSNSSILISPSQCISIALTAASKALYSPLELRILQQQVCSHYQQQGEGEGEEEGEQQSAGVYVFHLPMSSLSQQIRETYSRYTIHNWMYWKVSPPEEQGEAETGTGTGVRVGEEGDVRIEIAPSALVDETIKWKEAMPGGWKPPILDE
jgi:hypothetical protein